MGLFEASYGCGGAKRPPRLKSVNTSYNDETLYIVTLPKKDPKAYVNQEANHLGSADKGIFSPDISSFCCIKKYKYRLRFGTSFLFILTLFKSFKIALITVVTILIMSAKFATLSHLKIKIF